MKLKEKKNQSDNQKNEKNLSNEELNKNSLENSKQSNTYNFTDLYNFFNSDENVIKLDGNVILEKGEEKKYPEGILIDKNNIILEGNEHVIDAQNLSRIFNIKGKNITIQNVTLKNGFKEEDGGAILNEGEATLVDVILKQNKSTYSGGAVKNSKGTLQIKNSTLKENTSSVGAAIYNGENAVLKVSNSTLEGNTSEVAGCIGNVGKATLEDSTLKNNYAEENGGTIANAGNIIINNSVLTNNSAENNGGAIENQRNGRITITESVLQKNKAKNGGAIYSNISNITVKKSSFLENMSEIHGAAINNYVEEIFDMNNYDLDNSLICSDCVFENNYSNSFGGAVSSNDYLKLIKSKFKGNISEENGNIIYFDAIENVSFDIVDSYINNYSATNSDIFIKNPSRINIKNTVINNVSDNYVIHNQEGDVITSNIKFDYDKKAVYNNNKVWIDDESLENFIDSTEKGLVYCYNEIDYASNGFKYLENRINSGSDSIVLDCDIFMNESEKFLYPQGIELNHDNLIINGENHTIDANNFSRIFKITGNNIILKNINFKNGYYLRNKYFESKSGGGAIYISSYASITIENCNFIDNNSDSIVGCIYNKGVLDIYNSLFKNNFAQKICGTIFNLNKLNLYNCCFKNNFAPYHKHSHNQYFKTRGNVVNEGKITYNNCKFKSLKCFYAGTIKSLPNILVKEIMLTISISLFGALLGFFIAQILSIINPSLFITDYIWKLTHISLVVFVLTFIVFTLLTLLDNFTLKFMKKQGFEYNY